MYSFRMSFWTVPVSLSAATPCRSPTTRYRPRRIDAVALMVIDVETRSSGMPSSSAAKSSTDEIDTPTLPTSPYAVGASAS